MRVLLSLLFAVFLLQGPDLFSQEDQYRSTRKRVWKKWRKNRQSYNPYLDKKKKERPSAVMARENKKELKRQKRMAKRQMRKNKRAINKPRK